MPAARAGAVPDPLDGAAGCYGDPVLGWSRWLLIADGAATAWVSSTIPRVTECFRVLRGRGCVPRSSNRCALPPGWKASVGEASRCTRSQTSPWFA